MLRAFMIVSIAAVATAALPTFASAQVQRDPTGDKSIARKSVGKPMMMKKHKMMHHSMHGGMMKKPMTDGGM